RLVDLRRLAVEPHLLRAVRGERRVARDQIRELRPRLLLLVEPEQALADVGGRGLGLEPALEDPADVLLLLQRRVEIPEPDRRLPRRGARRALEAALQRLRGLGLVALLLEEAREREERALVARVALGDRAVRLDRLGDVVEPRLEDLAEPHPEREL